MIFIIFGFVIIFLCWVLLYYFSLKSREQYILEWQKKMKKEIDDTLVVSNEALDDTYETLKSARIEIQALLREKGIESPQPQTTCQKIIELDSGFQDIPVVVKQPEWEWPSDIQPKLQPAT
jgi:uncharacterized protein with NRDE domain